MKVNKAAIAIAILATLGGIYSLDKINKLEAARNDLIAASIEAATKYDEDKKATIKAAEELVKAAWENGREVTNETHYRAAVSACWDRKGKARANCVASRFSWGNDDAQDALARLGYHGGVFHEEHYKTRDAALSALEDSGWRKGEANDGEKEGELVWEHDYPRVMKLVETKSGWAWVGKLADLEPESKEGSEG